MAKNKEKQINFRIREDVKLDLEATAESRGLSVSSLIHSLIVKASKEEKESYPDRYLEIRNRISSEKENPEIKKVAPEKVTKIKNPHLQNEVDLDLTNDDRPAYSLPEKNETVRKVKKIGRVKI